MSYARFSSDDWKSDIYAFCSGDNEVTIYVAENRVKGVPKITVEISKENIEEYVKQHGAQLAYLKTAKREKITLPHAGETFKLSFEDAHAQLLKLRELGYHVPQQCLDAIQEEAAGDE